MVVLESYLRDMIAARKTVQACLAEMSLKEASKDKDLNLWSELELSLN